MKGEIFHSLPSTHLYLKERLQNGDIEPPYYYLALSQSAGIGTKGRKWSSPFGESLSLSVVFSEKDMGNTSLAALFYAACLKKFLSQEVGIAVQVKWPNDLYCHGKKIAGILVEKVASCFLIGIGINLNQKKFPEEIQEQALSLYQIDGKIRDVQAIFSVVLPFLEREQELWQKSPEGFWRELRDSWLYQGEQVSIIDDVTGEKKEGVFQEILRDGSLLLYQKMERVNITRGTLRKISG